VNVVVEIVVVPRSLDECVSNVSEGEESRAYCFLCQSQRADRGCKLYEAENQVCELVRYDGRDQDE
jgi:hypothetical protein